MTSFDLASELAAIPHLSLDELRARWTALIDKPLPRVRRTLLALALAYELQAQVHGRLPPLVRQRLMQLGEGRTRTREAGPGTKLVREWNGVLHTVAIGSDRVIHWDGRTWRSLSEVARAITGTRWSGPAFFGLKQRLAA